MFIFREECKVYAIGKCFRKNPHVAQRIFKGNQASIVASYFNKKKPVKMTIHGWTGDQTSPVNVQSRTGKFSFKTIHCENGKHFLNFNMMLFSQHTLFMLSIYIPTFWTKVSSRTKDRSPESFEESHGPKRKPIVPF